MNLRMTKGAYAGQELDKVLASLGLTGIPTEREKRALAIIEDCKEFSDIAKNIHDLKALRGSTSVFVEPSRTKLDDKQKEMVVSDFLISLMTKNYSIGKNDKVEVQPFTSFYAKALNMSSSIRVSSEEYETTFSQAIIEEVFAFTYARDIIENRFTMDSRRITLPYEDEMFDTAWIPASQFGNQLPFSNDVALSQITFEAHKLIAAARITDETQEDAILSLVPVLRRGLVKALTKSVNKAIISGNSTVSTSDANYAPFNGFLNLPAPQIRSVASSGSNRLGTSVKKLVARDVLNARRKVHAKARSLGELGIGTVLLVASQAAVNDLMEDDDFADVNQVGADAAQKLIGFAGRYHGIAVIQGDDEDFNIDEEAGISTGSPIAFVVAPQNFAIFEQRDVTTEFNRNARAQTDEYFVTTRFNMAQFRNMTTSTSDGALPAVCRINQG